MEASPRYSLFTSIMHWLMAVLIMAMLYIGWKMGQMPSGGEKYELMGLHKSLGVLALIFILLRIPGRIISTVAAREDSMQEAVGRFIHFLLYLLMLIIPVSGLLMSWAGGRDTHFFSLFTIPGANEPIATIASIANSIHTTVIYGLAALITLHLMAYGYHQYIKKNNILRRISLGS